MSVLVVSAVNAALTLMMFLFGDTRHRFFKRQAPQHSAGGSRRGCWRQGLHSGRCHEDHVEIAGLPALEDNSSLAGVPQCLHAIGSEIET